MIIIIATFGQAVAGQAHAVNILGVIIVWRGIMGIGIGGDYPLSAIISSEFASTHIRGRLMTAVFANQGWGQFAGALVALIIVHAYKNSILHDDPAVLPHLDQMWRILIGLGCVPAVIALYFRLTIYLPSRQSRHCPLDLLTTVEPLDTISCTHHCQTCTLCLTDAHRLTRQCMTA